MDRLYLHLWIDVQSHMVCAYEVSNTKVRPSPIDQLPRNKRVSTTESSAPKLLYDATEIQYVCYRTKAKECGH